MENRAWAISSEAGDGINGKSYATLAEAQKAVVDTYGPHTSYGAYGTWEEIPGEPTSPENAWEFVPRGNDDEADGEALARIEYALLSE